MMKSWIIAARPKTLTAAIIPVFVGTMLAKHQLGTISIPIFLYTLLCALCIQIATNLINDAIDFTKGADTSARLGPQRAVQSGLLTVKQVYLGGIVCFLLSILFGIPLVIKGGIPIAILLPTSIACGYLYTGGPKPLAYNGLGDLFVLLFFGIASTVGAYYLQTDYIASSVILASIQVGLLATVMIAINNLRDHVQDAKASKKTLAVRFGPTFAKCEITILCLLPFMMNIFWWNLGFHVAAVIPFLTIPLAFGIIFNVWKTSPGTAYNAFLGQAALLHMTFGCLLAITI